MEAEETPLARRFSTHKIAFVAASLAGLLYAPCAQAEVEEVLPVYGIEVRVGPYRPVLSRDPEVEAVRGEVFQDSGNWFRGHPLQFGIEFDVYPWTEVGLLGFYGRAGFWRQSERSRICYAGDGNTIVQCDATTILSSSKGDDDAAINIVPFSAGVIYRYDMLRRNYEIPLLLSAKFGFDYFLWWSTLGDSASRLASPDGPVARGGTIGLTGAVQVAFPLDAMKATAPIYGTHEAKQNNYIFLEYSLGYAPGLFQKQPRFDMSDFTHVTIGLSIDMN